MKTKFMILIIFFSVQAYAVERGIYTAVSAAGGINPSVAKVSADVFYRMPLFSDPGVLWNTSCIDLGLGCSTTPVDYSGSLFFNIEPIAIFNLKLSAGVQRYYTVLGYGYQGVDSPDAEYSPSAREEIDGERKTAYKFSAEPTLKFRAGKVIFANTFVLNYINMQAEDEYYYEPYSDLIHKRKDRDYSNSTVFLYEITGGLLAGVQNFYSRTGSVDCTSNRIAGIVIWKPEYGSPGRISIGAMGGSYTENKNYKGDLFALVFVSFNMKGE